MHLEQTHVPMQTSQIHSAMLNSLTEVNEQPYDFASVHAIPSLDGKQFAHTM
jgi:hypothetical protein